MTENYGGPFMLKQVRKNPGQYIDIGTMADTLLYPGQDKRKLSDKLRWFMKNGWLTPVARETHGKQSHLFTPDQYLVADVLLRMADFGIANPNASQAARLALDHWKQADIPDITQVSDSPAMEVIRDYEAGHRDWTFELWTFVNHANGNVRFNGRITANVRTMAVSLPAMNDTSHSVGAVFAVDLIDALDRIHPDGKAKRQGMN